MRESSLTVSDILALLWLTKKKPSFSKCIHALKGFRSQKPNRMQENFLKVSLYNHIHRWQTKSTHINKKVIENNPLSLPSCILFFEYMEEIPGSISGKFQILIKHN